MGSSALRGLSSYPEDSKKTFFRRARSQKSISSALLEKTAHRASIIDEIHLTLTISRYQKVSSLLREKEEVNTTIASRHAE